MHRVQELMREWKYEESFGKCTVLPPLIKPWFSSDQNCAIPVCQSCIIAWARKCTPNMKQSKALPEHEGALSHNKYEVGDFCLHWSIHLQDSWLIALGLWAWICLSAFSSWNNLQWCRIRAHLGWKSSVNWCKWDREGESLFWAVALGYELFWGQTLPWR